MCVPRDELLRQDLQLQCLSLRVALYASMLAIAGIAKDNTQ
jgi:hypothetical protein